MTRSRRYDELQDDNAIEQQAAALELENRTIRDAPILRIGYVSAAYIISYALAFLALASVVATVIVIILTRRNEASASLKVRQGPCNTNLQAISLVAHFFINLFGTIILGSSNYLQQICTSPSLTEITKQMKRRGDIYFGSNSPSSVMRQKNRSLTWLWLSLVLTSIPIHIMLNGIVGYAVTPVEQVFGNAILASDFFAIIPSNWTNVSAAQCATSLLNSAVFVTDFNNVTIVLNDGVDRPLDYNDFFSGLNTGNPYVFPNATDIETCFFANIDSECQITVRWFPLVCTATALIIKTFIALVGLHRHSHFRKRIFNSLGDMITVGARYPHVREEQLSTGSVYRLQKYQWVQALGRWDLGVAVFWWISALGLTITGAITWTQLDTQLSLAERFERYGLGTVTAATVFANYRPLGFPILVMIANSPQIWLSVGYLLWNAQVTRIWMEHEWRSYYRKPHIPRVSQITDEPGVRATRWLQLPYWVTAILMMLSTTMHWLLSQTLMVVEINAPDGTKFYLNYSPFAILCIGTVATVLVLGMTIYYFIPIRTNMPLMAGSARVVFESCRRLRSKLPRTGIAWGDISTSTWLAGFGKTVGPLIVGAKYPGVIAEEGSSESSFIYTARDAETEPLFRRV
jgi:hypothetical protein